MAKKDLAHAFAAEIKALRTASGISQEELADKAGLHRNYIGMIQRSERVPTINALGALAKAFRTRPSELIANAEARY